MSAARSGRSSRSRVAAKSPRGEILAYIGKYWHGLRLFLADGRIEIDKQQRRADHPAYCTEPEKRFVRGA